ncbi:MAG TPA: gluconate 2-dehydrogenase subunit 3 family protein [Pyrinomonadaceae bacterium]|nr:gluconate 2-dehydrogenase subunit 3 family protein [Pyrinomonadaceae bacterium]
MVRRQFLKLTAATVASGALSGYMSRSRGLELLDQQAASTSSGTFGSSELPLLRAVLDLIVPAEDDLPAVTTVSGIEYLQSVGREQRSIQEEIRDLLVELNRASQGMFRTAFEDSPEEFRIQTLRELEKRAPKLFRSFVSYVYEAYYTQPRVQCLIGCESKTTTTMSQEDEKLLLQVRKMERVYREVD